MMPGAGALTHIGNGVPDDLYAEARKEFSEKELVDLTWATAAINVWNRSPLACALCPGRINQRDTVLELPGEETKSHWHAGAITRTTCDE